MGYGKDSLVDCLERVYRIKTLGAKAEDLAGSYPDARSQRLPTAVVHAAREVVRRNFAHFEAGRAPVCAASFGPNGIVVHDPLAGENHTIYDRPIG
jgi:hypothetical protein